MERSRRCGARCRTERGSASVELIAAIPALLIAAAIAVQFVAAGHALWSAAIAARAGARAAHVGADPAAAARRALPPLLREGARVKEGAGGEEGQSDEQQVRVRVRVPAVIPELPRIEVEAGSSLGEGGPDG